MHNVPTPSPIPDPSLRELARLATPIVLSRIGIMVMGLTDTIVVGQHSSRELAYHALAWAPTMVVLTTAVGLLTGVQVLTARHVGEGRAEAAGGVLRLGLAFSLVIGLISSVLLYAGAGTFFDAMRLEDGLAPGATAAAKVFAWSMLPYLLSVALTFWLEALGKPVPAMIAMWAANFVNLALNLWLVPGTSGLGVEGAVASAWSTFGARIGLLLFLAAYVLTWSGSRAHGLFSGAGARSDVVPLVRIGTAAAASLFVETTAFAGMSIIAGWIGTLETAGWSIVLNVAAIIFMVPLGLAGATAVLVGRSFGAADASGVVRAGSLGFASTAALLAATCVVLGLADETIAAAYTRDPALLALVAPALVLSCLFIITDGLQVVAANALRARNDVWLPTLTHTISYVVVMLPLGWALALPMGMGITGILWAVILASLLAAGFLLARFWWLAQRPLPAATPGTTSLPVHP